jgi:hypothetical protein
MLLALVEVEVVRACPAGGGTSLTTRRPGPGRPAATGRGRQAEQGGERRHEAAPADLHRAGTRAGPELL